MMRLFAILAALLFAFASVSVSTISGALASSPAGVSAVQTLDSAVCQAEHTPALKSPIFKPCGKRINGQSVICHIDSGLLHDDLACRFERPAQVQALFPTGSPELSLTWAHFRPPQLS